MFACIVLDCKRLGAFRYRIDISQLHFFFSVTFSFASEKQPLFFFSVDRYLESEKQQSSVPRRTKLKWAAQNTRK